jgi:D-glycero-alpha-D-manno-heptose-7-phosphate kinase
MDTLIATPFILEVYEEALSKGATGGEVTGAGGGGHALCYCDFERKRKVAEALIAMGATVTDFNFESKGLVTWRTR